jgi:hypothetical protein
MAKGRRLTASAFIQLSGGDPTEIRQRLAERDERQRRRQPDSRTGLAKRSAAGTVGACNRR